MNPLLVNLLTFIISPCLVMQFYLFILDSKKLEGFIHTVGAGKAKDKKKQCYCGIGV